MDNTIIDEKAKEIQREYARKWRKNNPEKVIQYSHEWRKNNPDKVRAINERYWKKRAERELAKEAERDERP